MDILDGIAPIADRYDGYVLDLWGVVHDGKPPLSRRAGGAGRAEGAAASASSS